MYQILTPNQMKCAENASVMLGVSLGQLMDNAGEALGREVLSSAQQIMNMNIVILVGNGNNGGDGLVCASFLLDCGIVPTVILVCGKPKSDLAEAVFEKLSDRTRIIDGSVEEYYDAIMNAGIIVDCVFGTGFRGEISGNAKDIFAVAESSSAHKIACDVPSGVNALNGYVSKGTLIYDKTVTFHCVKLGMLLSPAKDYCGKISVADIGIPIGWERYIDFSIEMPEFTEIINYLPNRSRNSHKGTYGRLMLVCGSEQYMGAAMISANSALRSGVGIVNLCTPKNVALSLVSAMPECIFTGLKTDTQGFVSKENVSEIINLSKSASTVVIGCGLGVTEDVKQVITQLIKNAECPIVIDADGINCLSEHIDVLEEKQSNIILTPHPAELARLCGVGLSDIISDRAGYALSIAEKYNVVVHAKGTQTITALPDGRCFLTDFGNTALAKGGSGDMLAGLIGSFTAQKVEAYKACLLASCLMGMTAESLSKRFSERGLIAGDIISAFPEILKSWEQ